MKLNLRNIFYLILLIPAFYIISEKMARNFWKATGLKRIKFKYRMLRR